jgi:hypothetical protein
VVHRNSARYRLREVSQSIISRHPGALSAAISNIAQISSLPDNGRKTARPMSYTDRAEALPCRTFIAPLPVIAAPTGLRRASTETRSRLIGPRKYYYGLLETKFQPTTIWRGKRAGSRCTRFEIDRWHNGTCSMLMRALYGVAFEIRPIACGAKNRF